MRFWQRVSSWMAVWVVVAIGCGGPPADASKEGRAGKPQQVSATDQRDEAVSSGPMEFAQAPAGSQPAAGGGSAGVQGTAQFQGTPPAMEKVKMDADPVCAQQHATPVVSEEVVVGSGGGLKNVLVYVKEGVQGASPTPATPVVLDQSGCEYTPHVFGIQTNQPLQIVNSDATLHNINAKPTVNQPFNIAQPVQGMKTTKKFAKPELPVKFKCNVHPWMSAYAGVFEHPFFSVSGEDGSFAITGLPAGTYVLEAWHERYGTQTQTVSVGDGETKSVEWTFK